MADLEIQQLTNILDHKKWEYIEELFQTIIKRNNFVQLVNSSIAHITIVLSMAQPMRIAQIFIIQPSCCVNCVKIRFFSNDCCVKMFCYFTEIFFSIKELNLFKKHKNVTFSSIFIGQF